MAHIADIHVDEGRAGTRIIADAAGLDICRPVSRSFLSGTPGMKKSIALPSMCWLFSATPLERLRSIELVAGER